MHHIGTQVLSTERLTLRPFTLADAPAMFRNWASDPEVTKYLTWPTHPDVETSEKVLREWVALYREPDFYQWAIVPKDYGEPIGSIAAVRVDNNVQSVHIGYCIGRRWWRQGYTSEAMQEMLRFFFEDVGVNRIDSRHDPRNPNSGRVMVHCGMHREGTVRQGDLNNQGICDYVLYGILAEDYLAAKAEW